jgi:hypothetical protein
MSYETAQAALTAIFNIVAIAGLAIIFLDALVKQHKAWMAIYCPPVKPFQPLQQKVKRTVKSPVRKPVIRAAA